MLQGIKVIELASVLAGPSVGQFLAELGASVLKVENPKAGGDVTRSWRLPSEKDTSVSAYFSAVNWGKSSWMLDITQPDAKAALLEKIAEADIVLASYKPGDAEKLGVGYAQLQAINERLIYASITGYGPTDARAGYDAVIQAESGFMYMNGTPETEPTKMPVALVDVLTAHQLKQGILLALLQRERTGQGSKVEVSLFDAAVSALSNQATNWLNAGHIPQRMGSAHPNIVPYGTLFTAKDGVQILLAVGTDKQFASLCHIIGMPLQEAFATNPQRVKAQDQLLPLLSANIAQHESEALLQALHQAHVPAASVRNMQQVFEDPHTSPLLLQANGLKGVRQFVCRISGMEWQALSAPQVVGLRPTTGRPETDNGQA
jgi:crotonobetainyl-CoA:carnitine CoA-transferase CaiB-like acyl-CoA transferase